MRRSNFFNVSISGLIGLLAIGFLLSSVLAQTNLFDQPGNEKYNRRGIMDGNLVRTLYKNQGEVALWPDQPSGEWPSGSGHSYVDGVALIVAAEAQNLHDSTIHVMETQYREFVDVSPGGKLWGWAGRPYWFNMDREENDSPALSDDPNTWPRTWPDQPSSWDGYWNGYFGKGQLNADLETVFVFDDYQDKEPNVKWDFYADPQDTSRGGLGLWVKARGFQWSHVLAEDVIFWHYRIHNESAHDYAKVYYAQYVDWGIGGTDDGADDIGEYSTDLDIAFAYDEDGIGTPGNWSPVGVAGYAFLESPGISVDGKDNDSDGLVDEQRSSPDPGMYLTDPPYGIDDQELYEQTYSMEPVPHWSEDEDGDWVPFTDANENGVWDEDEPLNDDVGEDGVGPLSLAYTSPDDGEGDGMPTDGEPNYNETDPDESDQIGLTGFEVFPVHYYELEDDEQNWNVFVKAPPPHDEILRPPNLGMFFSSGAFPLYQDHEERYSMALLFGEDIDDLVKNKRTVQQIYNADYNFAKPPLKPTLKAVPGDGKVTLTWDKRAEDSYDPFLQAHDFEGYAIYRSTEPQFLESKVITDAYGNKTYRKPIAKFDLANGLTGPHKIGVFGIHYNMGEDTGLRHSYIDTDVQNGQTYYYAVVSYDSGFASINDRGEIEGIAPAECPSVIKVDQAGQVQFVDKNCAVVTPRPPSAGYIDPAMDEEILHEGPATGSIEPNILIPSQIPGSANTYQVDFFDTTRFNVQTKPSFTIRHVGADTAVVDTTVLKHYGQESPIFHGISVNLYNDTTISVNEEQSGWETGESDYRIRARMNSAWESDIFRGLNLRYPADFTYTFFDSPVTNSVNKLGYSSVPASVLVYNETDEDTIQYLIQDNDNSEDYTHGDDIVLYQPDSDAQFGFRAGWMVRFEKIVDVDTLINNTTGDTILDTLQYSAKPPQPGDVYRLSTLKPFRSEDSYRFTVKGADSSNSVARNNLDSVYVVPNPYIVAASWEPRNNYRFGRGERRLAFMNLPQECTIRIYTVRGYLVDKIEHRGTSSNGMAFWDILSKDDMEIAYGIYLYHIEAPGVGETTGKFAVIK